MNRGQRILQLQEELENSPEARVIRDLNRHDISVYIFNRNYQDLVHLRTVLSTNPDVQLLQNSDLIMQVMHEFIRAFHNFMASVMSLVDHTRRIYTHHYESAGTFTDYPGKKDEYFVNYPLHKFLKDFRNYWLHFQTPNLELEFAPNQDNEKPRYRFLLKKAELLLYNKWTSESRYFLSQQAQTIDILQLAEKYREKVLEFHEWFQNRRTQIHADEIDRFKRMEREYFFFVLEDNVGFYEGLNKEKIPHRKDDLFAPLLSREQIAALENYPRNSFERPQHAFNLISQKLFDVPVELKHRIMILYTYPDIDTWDNHLDG